MFPFCKTFKFPFMNPVALLELLEEGIILFRRILNTYDKIERISDVFSSISDVLREDLRSHYSIEGEEVYFFILGRETVRRVIPEGYADQEDVDRLTLFSLYQAIESRNSVDAKSCLVDFATALGQTFQSSYSSFNDWCFNYLEDKQATFSMEDPVLSFIQNNQRLIAEPVASVFEGLGVDKKAWGLLVDSVVKGKTSKTWINKLDSLSRAKSRPHKTQTFLGLIMRGANAVSRPVNLGVPILTGRDYFGLSLNSLIRPEPLRYRKEAIINNKGITNELVQSQSIRTMKARGYIKLADGEWVHGTEVTEQPSDIDPKKMILVKKIHKNDLFEDEGFNFSNAPEQDKLLGRVGQTIIGKIKRKGEIASREAYQDLETHVLSRIASLKSKYVR
jgi:hypothetical protein